MVSYPFSIATPFTNSPFFILSLNSGHSWNLSTSAMSPARTFRYNFFNFQLCLIPPSVQQEYLYNTIPNLARYFQHHHFRAFWKSAHLELCGNSCGLSWWRRSTRSATPVMRRLQFCSSFHLVAISPTPDPPRSHGHTILRFPEQATRNEIPGSYTMVAAQLLCDS